MSGYSKPKLPQGEAKKRLELKIKELEIKLDTLSKQIRRPKGNE